MTTYTIKLPDVGEGVAEAEFVELHVAVGDAVEPDQNLADVMTDKATVEIPSPRAGKVVWIGAEVGEIVAVGTEIIKIEVAGAAGEPAEGTTLDEAPQEDAEAEVAGTAREPAVAAVMGKALASPTVRRRAKGLGVDLAGVEGTGPKGRVVHEDLDRHIAGGSVRAEAPARPAPPPRKPAPAPAPSADGVTEIQIRGLRRKIAERMAESKRRIPHITYVDEVDVTALEALRAHMNTQAKGTDRPKLTLLPYLMRAIALAARDFPQVNARYDDEAGILRQSSALHIGIATQTEGGLMVPVVRNAEANDLWQNADEVARLSAAARDGSATREALSGSTITITSLGALGGIVTTPVINHPEVAIIGINKIQTLPRYDEAGRVVPRKLMNLSCGFDHRIVDGWDAASFVGTVKAYLEQPATMFV